MARNPSLRALGVQAEAAGLTLRSTRFGRRPDFAIGPQVEYTERTDLRPRRDDCASVLGSQAGRNQTATAEQQKALAEIEKTRLEIAGAVTKATKDLQLAREQLLSTRPPFSIG